MAQCEVQKLERIRLPISTLDGKAGANAPGERETRRREYTGSANAKS